MAPSFFWLFMKESADEKEEEGVETERSREPHPADYRQQESSVLFV
jgi:hypothetical protein